MAAETQEKTASQQIRAALVARGYRLQARRYVPKEIVQYRQLDDYFHAAKGQRLVLEIVFHDASGQEEGCALLRPVSHTNSIADTIAAIP